MNRVPVYLSPLAELKLEVLLEQIEGEWGLKSKRKFLSKLEKTVTQISIAPKSCEKSDKFDGLYKCVVSRQTSYYYRLVNNEIEIVTVIDNRQDLDRILAELKKQFG